MVRLARRRRIVLAEPLPVDRRRRLVEAAAARLGQLNNVHPLTEGLVDLLIALKWRGSARQLVEALPFGVALLEPDDIINILSHLGYIGRWHKRRVTANDKPCLLLHNDGSCVVVPDSEDAREFYGQRGWVIAPVPMLEDDRPPQGKDWLFYILREVRKVMPDLVLASFFINMLGLVVPIAIMVIYDQVIAKENLHMLWSIGIGVGAAALSELALKALRARQQAQIAARLDFLLGMKAFEQVLHLPPHLTLRAGVGAQASRLREFETIRDFIASSSAAIVIDLPFTLIFAAALLTLSPPLAVVPVVALVLAIILGLILIPPFRRAASAMSFWRNKRFELVQEYFRNLRTIKQMGAIFQWEARLAETSEETANAQYRSAKRMALAQNLVHAISSGAAAATLGVGTLLVMSGNLSLGALIASMMLIWRLIGPVELTYSLANQLRQLRLSMSQYATLLDYDLEQKPYSGPGNPIAFKGLVEFQRVSMRYTNDSFPALLGVSIAVRPGELVGIIGPSGCGKSTIGKMLIGMVQPQGGRVMIDGLNTRQLKPITLRQSIGYVPQENHAFPGTLYDNVIMADPTADPKRVEFALKKAGLWHKVQSLPNGLSTRLRDGMESQLPPGFLRQLALARAFLKETQVMFFDEPAGSLDQEDERYFLRTLELLRGDQTIMMVTQRPSHMRLCDRLIVINQGQLVMDGTPQEVMEKIDIMTMTPIENQRGASS